MDALLALPLTTKLLGLLVVFVIVRSAWRRLRRAGRDADDVPAPWTIDLPGLRAVVHRGEGVRRRRRTGSAPRRRVVVQLGGRDRGRRESMLGLDADDHAMRLRADGTGMASTFAAQLPPSDPADVLGWFLPEGSGADWEPVDRPFGLGIEEVAALRLPPSGDDGAIAYGFAGRLPGGTTRPDLDAAVFNWIFSRHGREAVVVSLVCGLVRLPAGVTLPRLVVERDGLDEGAGQAWLDDDHDRLGSWPDRWTVECADPALSAWIAGPSAAALMEGPLRGTSFMVDGDRLVVTRRPPLTGANDDALRSVLTRMRGEAVEREPPPPPGAERVADLGTIVDALLAAWSTDSEP